MVIITLCLQASEAIVLGLHMGDLIDHGKLKSFAICRRIFSFIVEIMGIILLCWLRYSIGKGQIFEIARQNCALDPVMQANFIAMANFRYGLGKKVWECIGLFIIIFTSEFCGLCFKLCAEGTDNYKAQQERRSFHLLNNPSYLSDRNDDDNDSESKYESTLIQ